MSMVAAPVDLVLEVVSRLFSMGGAREWGPKVERPCFFVYATGPTGRRWLHHSAFCTSHDCAQTGCAQRHGDDPAWVCPAYLAQTYRTDEQAKAAALALLGRIGEARRSGTWSGPEGSALWTEVRPESGSTAYLAGRRTRREVAQERLAA